MNYQKLKPCPFCGGKAHYGQAIKDIDTYTWVKWIYCTSCKAATGKSTNRAEVVRAWNQRVGDSDV